VTRRAVENESDVAAAAAELNRAVGSAAVLVTRSEAGMSLVPAQGEPVHVAAYPVKVRDVSGAGDTVVAVLAAMLAADAGFEPAMRAANAAAAVVVGKRGTATVSAAELRARILPAASLAPEQKVVFDWSVLDDHLGEWRRQRRRVGFTNGCFDLIHPGHVRLLAQARAACDRLVVGLNTDASVRRLAAIAGANHIHRILAVSDGTHLFRIHQLCESYGLTVYTSPRAVGRPIGRYQQFRRTVHEIASYTGWKLGLL